MLKNNRNVIGVCKTINANILSEIMPRSNTTIEDFTSILYCAVVDVVWMLDLECLH